MDDKKYFERLAFSDADLKKPKHDEIVLWLNDLFIHHKYSTILEAPLLERWSNHQIKTIGFVDIVGYNTKKEKYNMGTDTDSGKNIYGECDAINSVMAIEVKSEIKSIGEVLRQLQFYSRFGIELFGGDIISVGRRCNLTLCAPYEDDSQIANIIKSQGFDFISYPSEQSFLSRGSK
jgi:hypothetical protein